MMVELSMVDDQQEVLEKSVQLEWWMNQAMLSSWHYPDQLMQKQLEKLHKQHNIQLIMVMVDDDEAMQRELMMIILMTTNSSMLMILT